MAVGSNPSYFPQKYVKYYLNSLRLTAYSWRWNCQGFVIVHIVEEIIEYLKSKEILAPKIIFLWYLEKQNQNSSLWLLCPILVLLSMQHRSSSDLLHSVSATVSSKLWLILAEFSSSVQKRYLICVVTAAVLFWITLRDQEHCYHADDRAHFHPALSLHNPPEIQRLSL